MRQTVLGWVTHRSRGLALVVGLVLMCPLVLGASRPASATVTRSDLAEARRPSLAVRSGPSAEPTGPVRLVGSGFSAAVTVEVTIDSAPHHPRTAVVTDGRGGFATTIWVPATTRPGIHTLTATAAGVDPPQTATATVAVHTNWRTAFGDRHGTRSASTENVLDPSSAATLGLQWALPDTQPHNAAVVVDGVVYLATASYPDVHNGTIRGTVSAIDAGTGTTRWVFPEAAVAAPLVLGDEVWVEDEGASIDVLDRATGALKDTFIVDVQSSCQGGLVEDGGTVFVLDVPGSAAVDERTHAVRYGALPYGCGRSGSPPAVANGRGFFAAGRQLAAVDLADGSPLWSVAGPQRGLTASVSLGAPIAADGLVFISWSSGQVGAYRQRDGRQVWLATVGNTAGMMTLLDSRLVVQAAYGYSPAPLVSLDAMSGATQWRSTVKVDAASPMVSGGGVVVADVRQRSTTQLGLIDAATGTRLASYPIGLPQIGFDNLALSDGRLYFASNQGFVAFGVR